MEYHASRPGVNALDYGASKSQPPSASMPKLQNTRNGDRRHLLLFARGRVALLEAKNALKQQPVLRDLRCPFEAIYLKKGFKAVRDRNLRMASFPCNALTDRTALPLPAGSDSVHGFCHKGYT